MYNCLLYDQFGIFSLRNYLFLFEFVLSSHILKSGTAALTRNQFLDLKSDFSKNNVTRKTGLPLKTRKTISYFTKLFITDPYFFSNSMMLYG